MSNQETKPAAAREWVVYQSGMGLLRAQGPMPKYNEPVDVVEKSALDQALARVVELERSLNLEALRYRETELNQLKEQLAAVVTESAKRKGTIDGMLAVLNERDKQLASANQKIAELEKEYFGEYMPKVVLERTKLQEQLAAVTRDHEYGLEKNKELRAELNGAQAMAREFNFQNVHQIPALKQINTELKTERDALTAKLEVAREALNTLACWRDGDTVNSSFDAPGDAELARETLKKIK